MGISSNDQALQEHKNDVLVGMFDQQAKKAGSYFAPSREEEARLQKNATCGDVAKKAFNYRTTWFGNQKALVCALHLNAEFNPARPTSPVTFYQYDTNHYVPTTDKTPDQRDQELWTLKEVHEQAYTELKSVLDRVSTRGNAAVKEPYARYAIAHRNLEAALKHRATLIDEDKRIHTAFFDEMQDYADACNPITLFAELAPQTIPITGENPSTKAQRCLSHYEQVLEFFDTVGYYAPNSVRTEILGEAVIHLHDALENAPAEKAAFQKQIGNFLTFSSLLRQYTAPKSDADFRKELVQFLFDRSAENPSKSLMRSVMNNAGQKAKLEEMALLKKEAIAKAHSFRTLPKRAFRGMIISGYQFGQALRSFVSDRRMIGVTEIVQRALGKGDGWIPNLPYEDFLPDDDEELTAFTQLPGDTPQTATARNMALGQLSYRVHMHAVQAFEKMYSPPYTLATSLHHATKEPSFNSASAYLEIAKDPLETDVYGRLARLAQMANAHPEPGKTRAFGKEPDTSIRKNFDETQDIITKQVLPALTHIQKELEILSRGAVDDRFVTLLDDIENLESFIPMRTTLVPGRAPIQSHYPKLEKTTLPLATKLAKMKKEVQELIARHRKDLSVVNLAEATPAQRKPQGLAPTTQELMMLATELTNEPHHDTDSDFAQNVLNQSAILSTEVLAVAATIKKMDPTRRAPLMRKLFDALIEVRNTIIRNPINEPHSLKAAENALENAVTAMTALNSPI